MMDGVGVPPEQAKPGTVLQDSVEAAFRVVEERLTRLSDTFEQAFPVWIEVGRAANEAADRIKAFNKGRPKVARLNLGQELQRRFPKSATEISRARRLATSVKKRTPGGFPLPPAERQLPEAIVWAKEEGARPPSCLKEADQLLRDYNAAHVPGYAAWLAVRARRDSDSANESQDSPATVYRRRWRYETVRANALEALAEQALHALTSAGLAVSVLEEELGDIRDAWERNLRSEPLLVHAEDMSQLTQAEAALWSKQDAVDKATPDERLEEQRALGAAIEREGKRAFSDYDAASRGPWVRHVLGMNTEATSRLVRLHRVWPAIQHALASKDGGLHGRASVTLDGALALVAQREKEPGRRRDIFTTFLERHRGDCSKKAAP
ncbi:hypothetical protein [Falsiroseomonas oryziterrae]|uniref:hypothetical protein n=1 Tax=Falsiroseomonas oryziterrae TaxID=2911368 RepID=UPI001F2E0A21|nr:hypothetical protein [Roseomonas sp. NPKOSM-4]